MRLQFPKPKRLSFLLTGTAIAVATHAEWTAVYQAVMRGDVAWLAENDGASADTGGRSHLITMAWTISPPFRA